MWKHGISLYGWGEAAGDGFLDRHPELHNGRGTIRVRPADAAGISDEEFLSLLRGAVGA